MENTIEGVDPNILQKIEGLLNLSKKNTNEAEAKAAWGVAMRMAEKYRLNIALIEAAMGKKVEEIITDPNPLITWVNDIPWRTNLAMSITQHYGIYCYYTSHYVDEPKLVKGKVEYKRVLEKRLIMSGVPSDLAIARAMAFHLLFEVDRLSKFYGSGKGRVYINSWIDGCVMGIRLQLQEMRGTAQLETKQEKNETGEGGAVSSAIVLISNRLAKAEAFVKSNMKIGKEKAKTTNRQRDYGAYTDGREHGKTMDLTGSRKKIEGLSYRQIKRYQPNACTSEFAYKRKTR